MMQAQSVGELAAVELCKLMDTRTEMIDCLNGLIDQHNAINNGVLIFLCIVCCFLGFFMWRVFR